MEFERMIERVAAHRPRRVDGTAARASVALVLCGSPEPQFVVIRRSQRRGDLWSGHAALPGGRCADSDADAAETARRETEEEVGLALDEPVGFLDDIGGRLRPLTVTPVVFALPEPQRLRPDPREVAGAYWVPLSLLDDRGARTRHPLRRLGPWPGWRYETGDEPDGLVIWGLTRGVLKDFRRAAGL